LISTLFFIACHCLYGGKNEMYKREKGDRFVSINKSNRYGLN
jgi:hypothetical protein